MRAFLSHSSKDKDFVHDVATFLRPGTFELDSTTFDSGLVSSAAIIKALEHSDLFCLFLSRDSVRSPYVDFETLLGVEFFARGSIDSFLAICIDEAAFTEASANVKLFNVVRKTLTPEQAARLIQGQMVTAAKRTGLQEHPFMGREAELLELERQISDRSRPPSKVIYISGNFGSGRRTLAEVFYARQYRQVGRVFPTIKIEPYFGLEELYRKFLADLRPSISVSEFKTRLHGFEIAPVDEKRRLIAQLINSLIPAREAAFLIDEGGILRDSGALEPEFNEVVSRVEDRPYPPVIIISPRMIPRKLRRAEEDISYLPLKALTNEASQRLISILLKDRSIDVSDEVLSHLIELGDGHPFNIYRMMDEIEDRTVAGFLANPKDFIEWKHRHSSKYLGRVEFSDLEASILGLLSIIPELDFEGIVASLSIDPAATSDALLRLVDLHILESTAERFIVSPPLRVAVEKDRRLSLSKSLHESAIKSLSQTLSVRIEEGTAPIALIDAAVLSALESGSNIPEFTAAFLLPSHHVWLAERNYEKERYHESMRLAQEALKGIARLSMGGIVAASRFLCLSAARIGDEGAFNTGIHRLEHAAHDDWAKSNVAYLRGFSLRFQGNLPKAEEQFREALKLSPGNLHAAREIAAICVARGNLEEAEQFAREAYSHGPGNPYLIDMLISVLVKRYGRKSPYAQEIDELFESLRQVGEEGGRSFYTARRAEFEHLWGDNRVASELIEQAARKTPKIFEIQRIRVEILLKEGKRSRAHEIIETLREMVNARDPRERRANYREYLVTYAHYLQETGSFDEAKKIYDDASVFTASERENAIRDIEIAQAYKKR